MKTIDGPSRKRKVFAFLRVILVILLLVMIIGSEIIYHNYAIYNSISVVMKKNASIEYGTSDYDINDLIKRVEGKIVSVKNNIDTFDIDFRFQLTKDELMKLSMCKNFTAIIQTIGIKGGLHLYHMHLLNKVFICL